MKGITPILSFLHAFHTDRGERIGGVMDELEKIQEDAANQLDNQAKGEFISLYDLIEWAKSKHYGNFINATHDIFTILREENKEVNSYKYYTGIKPRTTKTNKKLSDYLLVLNKNHGYKIDDDFDDDIPF